MELTQPMKLALVNARVHPVNNEVVVFVASSTMRKALRARGADTPSVVCSENQVRLDLGLTVAATEALDELYELRPEYLNRARKQHATELEERGYVSDGLSSASTAEAWRRVRAGELAPRIGEVGGYGVRFPGWRFYPAKESDDTC